MTIDKIAILIKKASLEFDKISNKILASYQISASQYKILKYLFSEDNHTARVTDLEKSFSMTHPTTIGHIDVLITRGLVEKIPNLQDARGKLVRPTEKAFALEDELNKVGNDIENELTKNLSNREKENLVILLKKMLGVN